MKTAIAAIIICVLIFGVLPPFILGFSLWHLGAAMKVSAGMGAKLACSAKFISGFDNSKILEDLASYSPANRLLDLHYDLEKKRVDASFLNIETSAATYRPGLGCALEIGNTTILDKIRIPDLSDSSHPNENWPKGTVVDTINVEAQTKLDQLLAADNTNGYDTRALVVVKNGQLIAESYAPGILPTTPLLGWSMGKSVTSIMLGRLDYLNKLDLEQKGLFESWRKDERNEIALKHLLSMTSGLDFEEFYQPGSDATKMLFYTHSASDVALESELKYSPGTHFAYSSGTTNLIQRWIQKELGGDPQDTVDFLFEQIFKPLSMHNTVFETDPSGVIVGSSYIYASARDWARLGMLMAQEGQINQETMLDPSWVTNTHTPNNSKNYRNYGFQFWLNHGEKKRWSKLPKDAYLMSGNRKQYVMIIPSLQTAIVRLGWTKKKYPMEDNFATLL